jgi:hypothetical protein
MNPLPQTRLASALLPALGNLVSAEKNLLSPFLLPIERQPFPGELEATGLLTANGRPKPEFQPVLERLAQPANLVDLRFSAGDQVFQFSLYDAKPGQAAILLMNSDDGLLLEYPAEVESILGGLMQYTGNSLVASFDFQASLPNGQSLVLAALADLRRREVARAFANLMVTEPQPVTATEAAHWLAECPANPQWLTALVRQTDSGAPDNAQVQADLSHLAEQGFCKPTSGGFLLAETTLPLADRLVLIDSMYSLDAARMGSDNRAEVISLTALQAGVNDFLQIEFQGAELLWTSLSPVAFLDQVRYYLENGGGEPANHTTTLIQSAKPQAALACRQCGSAFSPNARFCPRCGAPIANE